jgi:hypothetical protein
VKRDTMWTIAGGVALLAVLVPMMNVMSRGTDWRIVQLYGGATSAQCLREPQTVEAFVLEPGTAAAASPEGPPDPAAPTVIGRYGAAPGTSHQTVDAATVAELSEILRKDESYDWFRTKSAPFRPTLGLRFVRDESRLELAVCFESDMIVAYRMGRFVGVEDIDPIRAQLISAARRLFPGDPRFASLPAKRR